MRICRVDCSVLFEDRTFRRVGDTREITANVRIVAATNRDLVTEVNEGRFREDLYYRLSVMPLYLPPLRARSREDLVELMRRIVDDVRPHLPCSAALDRRRGARPSGAPRVARQTFASCATCSSAR